MEHPLVLVKLLALVLLFWFCETQSTSSKPCPLGPPFPPPRSLSKQPSILAASKKLTTTLRTALDKGTTIYGPLDGASTSFSVDVYSLHEQKPLFTQHHSAPDLAHPTSGVSVVDSNTVYRLGSTSKLITVYLYLVSAGDTSWNDPITTYIPELASYAQQHVQSLPQNKIEYFDWHSVTVGALASQLGGIPRDGPSGPATDKQYTEAGFPPVSSINASYCGTPTFPILCSRAGMTPVYGSLHP